MSPVGSSGPVLGAEHEWADIQARYAMRLRDHRLLRTQLIFAGLSADGQRMQAHGEGTDGSG